MTVKENFDTEAGTINAGAARTISRSFYVFPYATWALADAAMHTPDDGEGGGGEGVAIDDTYELGTNDAGETVVATYYGTRSWNRVDGTKDTWLFNLEYTTTTSNSGNPTVYLSTQGDSRGTTKSVWRIPLTAYGWEFQEEFWDSPTKMDIGGNSIDSGGTPTSIVAVDRRFETTELKAEFPSIGALSDLVGSRNLSCHDGGKAGTVLYTGFGWNFDTSSGMWQIKHSFAVDYLTRHAEQVAKTNSSGDVLTTKFGSAPDVIFAASHVYFVQPFPKKEWSSSIPQFCDNCC